MNEADSNEIEERLARLERRVNRGKRATTATMGLLVLLIALERRGAQRKGRVPGLGASDLVARSVTIVDEQGIPRKMTLIGSRSACTHCFGAVIRN